MGTTTTTTAPTESKSTSGGVTSTIVKHWQLPIMLTSPTTVSPQIPWDDNIEVGDTVSFISDDGVPRVVFVGRNPFSTEPGFVVSDTGRNEVKVKMTAANPGRAYCWIRLRGTETYIGYGADAEAKPGYTVPPPKTGP